MRRVVHSRRWLMYITLLLITIVSLSLLYLRSTNTTTTINIFSSHSETYILHPNDSRRLPPPIPPAVDGTFFPEWNENVPLIYTWTFYDSFHVVLFGQGITPADGPHRCLIGNVETELIFREKIHWINFYSMFICAVSARSQVDGVISIIMNNGTVCPSVSTYKKQTLEPLTMRYHLCVATQIRNMADLIHDWLQYHRKIGIDHVYIYDNNSTDGLRASEHLEVIWWPFRRSQHASYTHAALHTRSRCEWTIFMDLDQYLFPKSSSNAADVLRRFERSNTAQLYIRSRRFVHSNLTDCPNATVPETYIQRRVEKQHDWETHPNSAIRSSFVQGLHRVHLAWAHKPFESHSISPNEMYFVHYSDRCWKQFISQKLLGRNGVRDWKTDQAIDPDVPTAAFYQLASGKVVNDTSFRDFKRSIDRLSELPPALT